MKGGPVTGNRPSLIVSQPTANCWCYQSNCHSRPNPGRLWNRCPAVPSQGRISTCRSRPRPTVSRTCHCDKAYTNCCAGQPAGQSPGDSAARQLPRHATGVAREMIGASYRRPLAILISTSIVTGPPASPSACRISCRTAYRVSSGSDASACPVEPPPRSKGPVIGFEGWQHKAVLFGSGLDVHETSRTEKRL